MESSTSFPFSLSRAHTQQLDVFTSAIILCNVHFVLITHMPLSYHMPIPLSKVLLSKAVNVSVFEEVQNEILHLTRARWNGKWSFRRHFVFLPLVTTWRFTAYELVAVWQQCTMNAYGESKAGIPGGNVWITSPSGPTRMLDPTTTRYNRPWRWFLQLLLLLLLGCQQVFLNKHNYYYCSLIYTGCPRRNVPDFGRVFLMLKYTDITQNTYVQSWTVTEIMLLYFVLRLLSRHVNNLELKWIELNYCVGDGFLLLRW